ncbi:MAG TPA: HEAT repeat domain-containing protein [Archangium sp.]|uniref:HEAT repeat domain-containing protein n=1 Tax=Archangium sp. TaxID=1872627 RepID=UPI002E358695|nr:HEAT repeat domain-containing protein [Archangium sp.]HEX5753660.1 HEAT repeat domain-containing protein [Archangium sp.]
MDNRERVRHLTSSHPEEVLEALRELKLDRDTPPSEEVMEAGLELMKSPDSELRYEAVWALCLHWGHPRTLPMLRAMLEGGEKDLEVQLLAARSIGSMVERCGHPDEQSFKTLARVALDESAAAELRGVAYTSLRAAAGLLPAQEEASLPEDIRQLQVDWAWLRALAG